MSGGPVIRADTSAFRTLANALRAAGAKAPDAIRRAVNHEGPKAKTAMGRVLVGQTGLKRKVITKALLSRNANFKSAAYIIYSRGGDIRLKFFGARETRKGVSAAPWGSRRVYAHTFTKGGLFPNRVALSLGGNVLMRAGTTSRLPIHNVKSHLFIPQEMVRGASEAAFYRAAQELPARLAHELYRILPA